MMKKAMPAVLAALLALVLLAGAAAEEAVDTSRVADASEMTDVIDVAQPDRVPVTAGRLNDGVYAVAVDSSSSMFKVVGCDLAVQDGRMTATLYMKSDSYIYMYPGPAEEAAKAPMEALSPLLEPEGGYAFELPLDALDAPFVCAAFSARKQAWYPRTLMFRSDSLPEGAWRETGVDLADGVYLADVSLTGGRAKLLSPAVLNVAEGKCVAMLVFATTKIDYVIVDGEKYLPAEVPDGVAFTVPVAAFDRGLSVIVDSTAITPAVEVPYTVTFDSASLVPFDE